MKNRQSGYHLQKVKIYQIFGKIALLFFPFSFLPSPPPPLTTNFPFPAYTQHSHHQDPFRGDLYTDSYLIYFFSICFLKTSDVFLF